MHKADMVWAALAVVMLASILFTMIGGVNLLIEAIWEVSL